MKFCNVCNNMLYLELVEDNKAFKYYCKNCKYQSEPVKNCQTIVSENNAFDAAAGGYKSYMTPFLIHDVTLPRVNNIDCPHCDEKPNKVIYVKYDNANMRYLYNCCHCNHFWLIDQDENF